MKPSGELNQGVLPKPAVGGAAALPLTTIHQPCAEMGMTAIAVMQERLQRPDLPARDVLLNFQIVIRASCGSRETTVDSLKES